MNLSISQSAKFQEKYNQLLQKVKERWYGLLAEDINISESKASRVLNKKQFDILTLIEMASICGYESYFYFLERPN